MDQLSLTVVTPSFNQAAFLSATIHSVLPQGYSNLEYQVIDSGSTTILPL
jgi:glycosyltransferase involved in cell wall biosynthesis